MDPEKGQAKVPLTFKEELTANTSGFIHDPLFTKLKKLTPIILLIALLLFFISYGSPYWAESTSAARRAEHLGLWRFCSEDNYSGKENCDDFINYNYNDWLKASQSFMTLAMFAFGVTLPAFVAYMFAGRFDNNAKILIVALSASGATAGLLIIGMCCFAFRYDEYFWQRDSAVPHNASKLSWAFYLALVSCLLTIIAPIFVILELASDRYLSVDKDSS